MAATQSKELKGDLHAQRYGKNLGWRNLGVLALLLGFVTALFLFTVVKFRESGGVTGNPSAGQGGAWIGNAVNRASE